MTRRLLDRNNHRLGNGCFAFVGDVVDGDGDFGHEFK